MSRHIRLFCFFNLFWKNKGMAGKRPVNWAVGTPQNKSVAPHSKGGFRMHSSGCAPFAHLFELLQVPSEQGSLLLYCPPFELALTAAQGFNAFMFFP
jgi:hypothetical protein